MKHLEPHKLLTASTLFQQLTPAEIALVLARLQLSHYEQDTPILERGVWHGRLYIVASGLVSVQLQATSSLQVALLGPGECFGELSLLTGEPPSATVLTTQETSLWSLTHADFLSLTATCPTLLHNMNRILSQRLLHTNRQLLLEQAAEVILLEILDPQASPPSQALPFHLAEMLTARTRKRVLLLDLCASDESLCLHFVTSPQQIRPPLLSCILDTTQLQIHRTPLLSSSQETLLAFTTLASTSNQLSSLPDNLHTLLVDLMLLYDYILLSITATTPAHSIDSLIQHLEPRPQHALTLLSASSPSLEALQEASQVARYIPDATLFVTNIPGKPILALQDHYTQLLAKPVKRLLPADEPLLTLAWQKQLSLHELAPHAELTQGLDFIARFLCHQTVGIAFGGGGARGFAHLGVLQGLLEHDVPLDYIAACSIGIMAPGMYLIGKSFVESERMFLEIQHYLGQWHIPRSSLFSNQGLKQLLQRACGDLRFEDLTTPFAMVAADLTTRSGVILDRGLLWQAGLASVSLPGIFPPVMLGEHILVDAGMHDPVPVRLARQMGADILLASELGGQEPPSLVNATSWPLNAPNQEPPHIIDLLLRSYDLAMATIGMHSIREADIVIRPKLHHVSLRQFSEGRSFIARGHEMLEQILPQIRQRLPWLP
jgi:NTE family protein